MGERRAGARGPGLLQLPTAVESPSLLERHQPPWLNEGEGESSWGQRKFASGPRLAIAPLCTGGRVSRRGRMLRPVPDHKACFTSAEKGPSKGKTF